MMKIDKKELLKSLAVSGSVGAAMGLILFALGASMGILVPDSVPEPVLKQVSVISLKDAAAMTALAGAMTFGARKISNRMNMR